MILSQIRVDPKRFQKRGKAFSEQTVSSIVAGGIDLAKFDPIPLLATPDGVYVVAGDGHSRFEAITRLAVEARLPDAWAIPDSDEWDVPHRIVTEEQARKLSRTANLSRDNFTLDEIARIFQEMVDEGMSIDAIAQESHCHADTVRGTLKINALCADIRERIGKSTNAGGLTKDCAIELADQFVKNGVTVQSQQQIWHKILVKMDLTPANIRGMRGVFARVGQALREKQSQDVLFSLPPNVDTIIAETKDRAGRLAKLERAITALAGMADDEVMASLPMLRALLRRDGEGMIQQLKYEPDADGASIGNMVLVA